MLKKGCLWLFIPCILVLVLSTGRLLIFCLTKTTLMREGRTLKKKRSKERREWILFVGRTPFILGIKLYGHCLIDSDTTELIKHIK